MSEEFIEDFCRLLHAQTERLYSFENEDAGACSSMAYAIEEALKAAHRIEQERKRA